MGEDAYLVGPKWLETARIDVVARAFADTNPANLAPTDEDVVRLMLRSLLMALSLQDAVRRQLGLRLENTKLPVPVLVIDSISENPLQQVSTSG